MCAPHRHVLERIDATTVAHELKELVSHELSSNAASCTELAKALASSVERSDALAAEIASLAPPEPPAPVPGAPAPTCALCRKKLVFGGRALVFPCGHAFHEACFGFEDGCLLCGDAVIGIIELPFE